MRFECTILLICKLHHCISCTSLKTAFVLNIFLHRSCVIQWVQWKFTLNSAYAFGFCQPHTSESQFYYFCDCTTEMSINPESLEISENMGSLGKFGKCQRIFLFFSLFCKINVHFPKISEPYKQRGQWDNAISTEIFVVQLFTVISALNLALHWHSCKPCAIVSNGLGERCHNYCLNMSTVA